MPYQIIYKSNSLSHHGILGQKWGVRRYQNKDGSLTPAGRRRLTKLNYEDAAQNIKDAYRQNKKSATSRSERVKLKAEMKRDLEIAKRDYDDALNKIKNDLKGDEVLTPKQKSDIGKSIFTGIAMTAGVVLAGKLLNRKNKEEADSESVEQLKSSVATNEEPTIHVKWEDIFPKDEPSAKNSKFTDFKDTIYTTFEDITDSATRGEARVKNILDSPAGRDLLAMPISGLLPEPKGS